MSTTDAATTRGRVSDARPSEQDIAGRADSGREGAGREGAEDFAQRIQQVEQLVQRIEASSDANARAAAREMVRTLLDLHGAGLARVLELLGEAGESGRSVLEACAQDELVRSLLMLHELHPESVETRVRQALVSVRPYLESHGGGVTLLDVSAGTVRLRLDGSCDGCPSSAATLQHTIEQAILQAAPEVDAIEVEGDSAPSAPSHLVQLEVPSAQ